MELDPIWVVAVLIQWQPCGRVLLKDLRRWIVVKYLLDPMIIITCWRASRGMNVVPFPLTNTWRRIVMGKRVKAEDISWRHIPALVRVQDFGGLMRRACTDWVDSSGPTGYYRHATQASPLYDGILACRCYMYRDIGRWQDRYHHAPNECSMVCGMQPCRNLNLVACHWGGIIVDEMLASPWLAKQVADGCIVVNEDVKRPVHAYRYTQCVEWFALNPVERGIKLIDELVYDTGFRRLYTRSGVSIIVSLRRLRTVDRAKLDEMLVGLYTANVMFVI